MSREALKIRASRGEYSVSVEEDLSGLARKLGPSEHLIIDAKVAEAYQEEFRELLSSASVLRIEAKEENKSLEKIPSYMLALLKNGIKRNHELVVVGGGIIQDICAFISSTLFRGIRWRFYPSTLLAQADSCIGSKSSINLGHYKNQVGTFWPPSSIHISTKFLGTLEESEIRSGIGEIIKVHILSGSEDVGNLRKNFDRLLGEPEVLTRFLIRSLEIKKRFIEKDEFDQNERLVLNYGHSFGHAIESATSFAVPHGIAVTLGMDIANYVSRRLGLLGEDTETALREILRKNAGKFYQTKIPQNEFFEALARDKKNTTALLNLILIKSPGQSFRHSVPLNEEFRGICRTYFDEKPLAP